MYKKEVIILTNVHSKLHVAIPMGKMGEKLDAMGNTIRKKY